MSRAAVIKCFAKINLFLDVVCKRADGYHNIETIFQTISLHDVMELELTPSEMDVTCDDPTVPTDRSNLALKAFLRLKEATGCKGGVRIKIKKNIPPGSGLGGGSSNAAAALVALNRMLGGGLSEEQLRGIARDLGADVPFFISGGLAAAWQIGDRLMTLPPIPESFIVIAVPDKLRVSTPQAYAMTGAPNCLDPGPESFSECSDRLKACVQALSSDRPAAENDDALSILHNALERPVFSRYPAIAELKDLLLAAGAGAALMSGSGSAVFGVADSIKHANQIKSAVEESSGASCFAAQTLDRGWELIQKP